MNIEQYFKKAINYFTYYTYSVIVTDPIITIQNKLIKLTDNCVQTAVLTKE